MNTADAINHKKSIIVKAPAGSGKTELLVQRYLALLARGCDDPCQIVAITFTRKAAAEMRSRIRQELSRKELPTETHKLVTYDLAQEVKSKAASKNWNTSLLVTEDNVTTIDSFCHSLVSLDPLKANFMTMPDIFTDNEINLLYKEAGTRAITAIKNNDEHRDEIMHLLYIHNNSPNKLKSAISNILANRVKVLPVLQSSSYDPEGQLQLLIDELLSNLRHEMPVELLDRILKTLDNNLANLEAAHGIYFTLPAKDTDWHQASLADWQVLAGILFIKTGAKLKEKFTKNDGFIAGDPATNELKQLVEELSGLQYKDWVAKLSDCRTWHDQYTEIELASVKAAQTLIRTAAAYLTQIFKEQNKCDHTEIMLAAIEVMGQEDSPTLLAERLGYRLRHLLVDEFQDTSLGQLRLLEAITSHWDLTTNNSLFLVGDPMQSIYAFRQADVRIFNQLWEEKMLGQIPLECLTLQNNYRSQPAIVEWLNTNFENIFPHHPDNLINGVAYTQATAKVVSPKQDTQMPPAHLSITYDKKTKISNRQLFAPIIKQLKEITNAESEATIGILARSRNNVSGLISLLHEEKLDFDASKFTSVQDNPIIMDLISLTRAIYNIQDEVAWYACLRAPYCGLKLADIWALAHMNKDDTDSKDASNGSIWSVLKAIANKPGNYNGTISKDAIDRIQHFSNAIQEPMLERRRSNWHDVINKAWKLLQGDDFINSRKDLNDVGLFMSNVRECSAAGVLNLNELENKLEQTRASFESQAKIKILTIHHSKGLEFDYVFIANMNKRVGGQAGTSNLLTLSNFIIGTGARKGKEEDKQDIAIISVNSPMNESEDEPINRMVKPIQDKQGDQELRRLLYVACSRARQGLFLHYAIKDYDNPSIENSKDAKGLMSNSLLKLIYDPMLMQRVNNPHHITYIALKDTDNKDHKNMQVKQKVNAIRRIKNSQLNTHKFEQGDTRDTASFPSWQDPYERCQGIAIHSLMELLAEKSPDEIQTLATDNRHKQDFLAQISSVISLELKQLGLDESQTNRLNKNSTKIIDFCLKDERALWIVRNDGMNECEFAYRGGAQIMRIDRTFVDKDVRWIIDYKTTSKGSFSEADIESFFRQLNDYGDVMRDLQKGQDKQQMPIKLAVYCPQNGFWQESDYNPD